MKVLERLELVDRIGRELQSRMSFSDIDCFLHNFGVDTTIRTSGVNSKWVYTKELLAESPPETVLKIANELDIPHSYVVNASNDVASSTCWEPYHFRLFICHLASFKETVAALQAHLRNFGISAFVAHVDIQPTREWQDEIEAGLFSMDALAAILMTGFERSRWTDQEVGVAVGRGVVVLPIIRGLNPYGFIAKYQGLSANGKTVKDVAREVFAILTSSPKTRTRLLTSLVDTILQAANEQDALVKLCSLASVEGLPTAYLERLREGAATASVIALEAVRNEVDNLLLSRGLNPVSRELPKPPAFDDEIPF